MPDTVGSDFAAESSGPNASLQFGQVAQNQALADSLKSTNPQAYAASQQPGEPGQGAPAGSPPPQQGGPPPQGAPAQPPQSQQKPWSAEAQFPDLSDGKMNWRQRLQVWAAPEYPYLSYFARQANVGLHGQSKKP